MTRMNHGHSRTASLTLALMGIALSVMAKAESAVMESTSCFQNEGGHLWDAIVAICSISAIIVSVISLVHSYSLTRLEYGPVIVVDIEQSCGLYILYVSNIGKRLARNVRLHLTPRPKIDLPVIGEHAIPFIDRPIPQLLPGQKKQCAFANIETLKNMSREQKFSGEVTYINGGGKETAERIEIDVRTITDCVVLNEKTLADVVNVLKSCATK